MDRIDKANERRRFLAGAGRIAVVDVADDGPQAAAEPFDQPVALAEELVHVLQDFGGRRRRGPRRVIRG